MARVQYSISMMLGLLSLVVLVVAIQLNFAKNKQNNIVPVKEVVLVPADGGTLKGSAELFTDDQTIKQDVLEEPELPTDSASEEESSFDFTDYQQEHLINVTADLKACLSGGVDLPKEELRVECIRIRRKRTCIRRSASLEGVMGCLEEYGRE